jgi:hypothetical protein
MTDEQTKQQGRWIFQAIVALDASEEEQQALSEIFHVEGFGGAEFRVMSFKDALRLAQDRLEWLREQRANGDRWE